MDPQRPPSQSKAQFVLNTRWFFEPLSWVPHGHRWLESPPFSCRGFSGSPLPPPPHPLAVRLVQARSFLPSSGSQAYRREECSRTETRTRGTFKRLRVSAGQTQGQLSRKQQAWCDRWRRGLREEQGVAGT